MKRNRQSPEEIEQLRRLYEEDAKDYFDTVHGLKMGKRYVERDLHEAVVAELTESHAKLKKAESRIARLKAELAKRNT